MRANTCVCVCVCVCVVHSVINTPRVHVCQILCKTHTDWVHAFVCCVGVCDRVCPCVCDVCVCVYRTNRRHPVQHHLQVRVCVWACVCVLTLCETIIGNCTASQSMHAVSNATHTSLQEAALAVAAGGRVAFAVSVNSATSRTVSAYCASLSSHLLPRTVGLTCVPLPSNAPSFACVGVSLSSTPLS
jgi:hypothetical protein